MVLVKEGKKRRAVFLIIGTSFLVLGSACLLLMRAIRPIPESALRSYIQAKNLYVDGKFAETERILQRFEPKEPKFFQASLLLAKTLYFQGKDREADRALARLLKRYPMYHEAGLWKARTEIRLGRAKEAKARIEELLSWQSEDPRLLAYLGRIGEADGDIRSALEYYSRAALFEEECGKNRLEAGRLYWKLQMPDRALRELEQSLALFPPDSLMAGPARELREKAAASIAEKGKENEK